MSYPTTNGGMQHESLVGTRTHCIHVFARLALICKPSRCLLTKISASELSRKFIKSALLVGYSTKMLHVMPLYSSTSMHVACYVSKTSFISRDFTVLLYPAHPPTLPPTTAHISHSSSSPPSLPDKRGGEREGENVQ